VWQRESLPTGSKKPFKFQVGLIIPKTKINGFKSSYIKSELSRILKN
jgi:hypothetical protein